MAQVWRGSVPGREREGFEVTSSFVGQEVDPVAHLAKKVRIGVKNPLPLDGMIWSGEGAPVSVDTLGRERPGIGDRLAEIFSSHVAGLRVQLGVRSNPVADRDLFDLSAPLH